MRWMGSKPWDVKLSVFVLCCLWQVYPEFLLPLEKSSYLGNHYQVLQWLPFKKDSEGSSWCPPFCSIGMGGAIFFQQAMYLCPFLITLSPSFPGCVPYPSGQKQFKQKETAPLVGTTTVFFVLLWVMYSKLLFGSGRWLHGWDIWLAQMNT